MNFEKLFIYTMCDLEACAWSAVHYHRLRIPGLIRLLLLDECPLYARMRDSGYRSAVNFTVGRTLDEPPAPPLDQGVCLVGNSIDPEVYWFSKSGLDEPRYIEPSRRRVGKDTLLRLRVMWLEGTPITVKQLVRNMAYVRGLTHANAPETLEDALLLGLRDSLRIMGAPVGFETLRAIGRVVHRGLLPLMREVHEGLGGTPENIPVWDYDEDGLRLRPDPPLPPGESPPPAGSPSLEQG